MKEITLISDLYIGKKTITEEGREPYETCDLTILKGSTLRKHDNGLVDIYQKDSVGHEIVIPIISHRAVYDRWTDEMMTIEYNSLGKKTWQKALEQTQ